MQKIPITFTHGGKEYKGSLDEISGAASKVWHLMIDHYYCGRLRLTDRGWVFDPTPKDPSWTELANYFGEHVYPFNRLNST